MGKFDRDQLDQAAVIEKALDQLPRLLDHLGLIEADRTPNGIAVGTGNGSLRITTRGASAGLWCDFGGSHNAFGKEVSGGDLVYLFAAYSGNHQTYGHALRALDVFLGGPRPDDHRPQVRKPRMRPAVQQPADAKMTIMREIVATSVPVPGSRGEAYLRNRGIDLGDAVVRKALFPAMKDLRFHPTGRLYYAGATERTFHSGPAVLLVGRDEEGEPTNIQQIFLKEDGSAKLSLKDRHGKSVGVKRSLCPFRNPLRLPAPDGLAHELTLTEGPENAMSLRLARDTEVWACFGNANLSALDIPYRITHLTIASDGDAPNAPAEKVFRDLAYRYRWLGYHVRLVSCRDNDRKLDANDFLQEHGALALAGRIDATPFQSPYPVMDLQEGMAALQETVAHTLLDLRPRIESLITARVDSRLLQVADPQALKTTLGEAAEDMRGNLEIHANGNDHDLLNAACETARQICSAIARTKVGQTFRPDGLRKVIVNKIARLGESVMGATEADTLEGTEIISILQRAVGDFETTLNETLPSSSARGSRSLRAHKARMTQSNLPVAPPAVLILGTPGLGKTHSLQHIIRELGRDAIIWVLQPTSSKAEEFEQETREVVDVPITVVRGRGATLRDGTAMCERHEFADRLSASGRQIGQSICRRVEGEEEILCPHYADCVYIAQQEALKAHEGGGVFVMSHTALTMPSAAPRPDLVIVDEDPSFSLLRHAEIDASRFAPNADWRKCVEKAQVEMTQNPISEESMYALFDIVDEMGQALSEPSPLHALAALTTAKALREAAKTLRLVEEQQISPVRPDMPDRRIKDIIEHLDELEIKQVGRILRSAADELEAADQWFRAGHAPEDWRSSFNGITIDLNAKAMVNGRAERLSRVGAYSLAEIQIAKGTPIVVLDGTADPELLTRALRRPVEPHRIDVQRQGEVIQVYGKSFSNRSLILDKTEGSGRRNTDVERLQLEVVNFVENERARAQTDIFVCSALSVEKEIITSERREAWEAMGISWSHFGATRGINRWQTCPTAILIGRKQPPPRAALDTARAFFALDREPLDNPETPHAEPRYVRAERWLFDKQGNSQSIDIDAAQDPRVQRVLWQMREAEIIQALDRVRALRHFRRIILLGDVDLRRPDDPADGPGWGLPADAFFRWSEVSAGETRLEAILRLCDGFLPLAPQLLQRLAHAEFRTVAAAKKWLQRAGLGGTDAMSNYNALWIIPTLKRLSVRPVGTRGKGFHLLLDASRYLSIETARARFEEMIGGTMAMWEYVPSAALVAPAPDSAAVPPPAVVSEEPVSTGARILGQSAFQRRRENILAKRANVDAPEPPAKKVAMEGRLGRPVPHARPVLEVAPPQEAEAAAIDASLAELAARQRFEQIVAQVLREYKEMDETDPEMWR
ncbi:hypothetical protein EYC08_20700 [Tabrizicola sp. WMC-M-20]|nr:hypothetical protein EYC08_20700 [Tabrizicola sp. WMC-M-20]